MNIAALLFPDIALILIGWLVHRHGTFSAAFWDGLERLVYFLLFPALLFGAIVRNPLSPAQSGPMLAAALGALLVGIALGYLAKPALNADPRQFASGVQCAFRFNSYITLALALRIGGSEGLSLAALIVGFVVPTANLAAVYALARNSGAGLLQELARNPLVLATVGGLLVKSTGVKLPEPLDATLIRLGQAALTLGLICVGAGLRLQGKPAAGSERQGSTIKLSAWFTATKLIAMPLTALLIGKALGLPKLPMTIAVMYASMPTAPASYVLATRMGGDGGFVAFLITASTIGALIALPFWLWASGV
ncbi:MAG: AEC family transporter [Quisquiliibacterium sp.]